MARVERSVAPRPGKTMAVWRAPRGAVARKGAAASRPATLKKPRDSRAKRKAEGGVILPSGSNTAAKSQSEPAHAVVRLKDKWTRPPAISSLAARGSRRHLAPG